MIKSKSSKIGDWIIVFICLLLILICLLPILNIVARSMSSANALIKNKVTIWPVDFNLDAYKLVLGDAKYTWSLTWTAILTVICTLLSMFMTIICAYPLTYGHLKGRKFFNLLIVFTMYFNAGIIPNYLLLNSLHMLNNPSVMIIPSCLSVFNMILMRSFFYGIPDSLRESTEIDGAGPLRILISIYLPLSAPVLATVALFYAVGRWNGYQDALFYMKDAHFYPIQMILFNILRNTQSVDTSILEGFQAPGLSETLKSATIVFAIVPILIIYPWLQKYFVSGATLGAIKE